MRKILVLLIFFWLSDLQGSSLSLTGRVVIDSKGVDKAQVIIREINEKKEYSAETDKDGYYQIKINEGVYFVEAKKNINNKNYIGFSGKNPILLTEDSYIGIKLLPESKLSKRKLKNTDIILLIKCFYNGKPVESARVYLYLKEKDIKGMPYVYSNLTNKNGVTKIDNVLEGNYYIVVRKKTDDFPLGPIREGDLIGFFSKNPLEVKEGYQYNLEIHLFEKVQDEVTKPVDTKKGIKILGKAIDENGNPVSGVYAFLYTKKEMGHERPVSISSKTKDDGKFELIAPFPGKYYLGVRQYYGGTPIQGELYGLYDKTYDHHINVFENITGILIKTKKILR